MKKNIKNYSIAIITSVMMVFGPFVGYADVVDGTAAMTQTGVTAESLINNYKQKIFAADTISYRKTCSRTRTAINNGVTDQTFRNTYTDTKIYHDRYERKEYDGLLMINGVTTGESNRYSGASEKISNIDFQRANCFIVNYKGNETLSFTGTEYVITGFLTKDELYIPDGSGGVNHTEEGSALAYMSIADEKYENEYSFSERDAVYIANHLSEIRDDEVATYECRFDAATGDLISLKIDASQLFNYRVRQLQAEGTVLQVQAETTMESITLNDPNVYIEDWTKEEETGEVIWSYSG